MASQQLLGVPLLPTSTGSSSTSAVYGASGYTPKVSFDTFENPAAPMFSFTLPVKSDGYKRNRSTRVFLVAASPDESGTEALDWVMESLVQDGDELIVFRGFDTEELDRDHEVVREEARELLRQVQRLNTEYDPDRKISIIVEFIAGKVTETIERLIALYRPDSLVVGTRGLRGVKVFGAAFGGMGSVSKYCLSHSPVPVIVVRPERKVRKTMMKRRLNPKRGTHFEDKTFLSETNSVQSPAVTPLPTRQ
ncbi:uncharacterized protein FOMMEDRAFT_20670 [Fomitiporia mediterranea MF3/22]|uniref:uncharacterized protein n=1 Tax=Fomitiporia mediterranea (strain MF3/22) TaxID=694068 RepID=UPI0004407965|nr:uncharacterized protein FOMMEDRAFT_20670 [Fomitiporia mediterranea MF3/22]EJD01892.1 hypothetical protein FOMMEDRAFT_20670 [Fomitiporia mediterranea MF3/22]